MKNKITKVATLFILLLFYADVKLMQAQKKPPNSLRGLVLILDPGHGGQDPGSHGVFNGQEVFENEYVYDVAKRVEIFARERDAIVFKTIKDGKMDYHRNWAAQRVFPDNRDEYFSLDSSRVVARTKGLQKRVVFANKVKTKYPKHRVVFLSIHFDIIPDRSEGGSHILIPQNYKPKVAESLIMAFRELNSDQPIKVSGKTVKNIFILSRLNRITEKILLELGNFLNENDNWEIRNYQTRNRYALRIIRGLEIFMKSRP